MDLFSDEFKNLKYVYTRPENFDDKKQYSCVILLHGAGYRGTDINLLKENPFFLNFPQDCKALSFAPQCYGNSWFDIFNELKEFILFVKDLPYVNSDKIVIMGASMGSFATWQVLMSLPKVFAGAIPICGGGMDWNAEQIKHIPIWIFHGVLDDTVDVSYSMKMFRSLKRVGGNVNLTLYPEANHDSWTATYRDPKVWEWIYNREKNY